MATESIPTIETEISDTMRDYLAEIYRIGHGKMWVGTSAIADYLNVSRPAAVRMVSRLQKKNLVKHLPYQGVFLTKTGQHVALLSIRRHRLVERFLVDILKFGWHEAHDEADILDKGINQRLEDRIDALMGHPTTCPHGDPIPTREGIMPEIQDRPLTVVPAQSIGKISRIRTRKADKLQYLAKIGLVPNAPFELIRREPFNGPIRLKVGRNEQVVGVELAATVWVLCDGPAMAK